MQPINFNFLKFINLFKALKVFQRVLIILVFWKQVKQLLNLVFFIFAKKGQHHLKKQIIL